MVGLSDGQTTVSNLSQMIGNVTTKKNGDFIQIRTLIIPLINVNKYEGIYIKIYRNNKNYALHLKKTYLNTLAILFL